jgi:hypothetical protein
VILVRLPCRYHSRGKQPSGGLRCYGLKYFLPTLPVVRAAADSNIWLVPLPQLTEDEFCCEAEACVPVAEVVEFCLSGKACVPNAIAAMYKGGIAVCTSSECTAVGDSLLCSPLAASLGDASLHACAGCARGSAA